jgi:hypothetical protein
MSLAALNGRYGQRPHWARLFDVIDDYLKEDESP